MYHIISHHPIHNRIFSLEQPHPKHIRRTNLEIFTPSTGHNENIIHHVIKINNLHSWCLNTPIQQLPRVPAFQQFLFPKYRSMYVSIEVLSIAMKHFRGRSAARARTFLILRHRVQVHSLMFKILRPHVLLV